jgi:23S rRNA-/tRNA-specific pseudouridylate synthase
VRPGPRRDKRWVVRPGDGATVGAIVRRAREDLAAIAEGRVFVGRRRVRTADEPVRPGDEVRIGEREATVAVEVLFQGDDLLAVAKPAGIPTVPDHQGAAQSLVASAARAAGKSPADLRVTSRLDREVSGAVVFALSPEAETRLREARARGVYARRYVALGTLINVDAPDQHDQAIHVWRAPIDEKPSESRARVVARAAAAPVVMIAVDPQTGRTHQIRIHASGAGMPLLGDRDYGGPGQLTLANGAVVGLSRIALHAARIVVPGKGGRTVTVEAPIPEELRRVWTELGGAPEAWNTAISCETSEPEPSPSPS